MKKEKWIYKNNWIVFYFGWQFEISYETCGYFDARHRINLDLIFFNISIILPIKSKHTDECDPPKWGIAYHNQIFWIYRGGKGNINGGNKWWTFRVPWRLDWVRTSNLRKDGTWEHEIKGDRKDFYKYSWKKVIWNETYPYTYTLKSGVIQERLATIKVEEREWRWYWFKWLPYPRQICKTIAVDFSDEVGERTGSWKGGTTGCGYNLLSNETPLECLRRMEKERSF